LPLSRAHGVRAGRIVAQAAVDGGHLPTGLHTTPFEHPLYDTLAVAKQRGLPLSPATRELVSIALERLSAFERHRGGAN
jgi:hypothetical protein